MMTFGCLTFSNLQSNVTAFVHLIYAGCKVILNAIYRNEWTLLFFERC